MYTNETQIEQFIKEYLRSRIVAQTSVYATLKKALQAEHRFKKPFVEFTSKEILEMYKSQHSRSIVSIQNQNVILKHATRWFIASGFTKSTTNNYELITKEDIEKCVDIQKRSKMLLSEDDVRSISNDCMNAIDKAILWLLFYGVAGEWLKELTFLQIEQLDKNSGILTLRELPTIQLSKEIIKIVIDAFNETQIVSYGDSITISEVQGRGQIYKIRNNTIFDTYDLNNQKNLERRFRWVLRRITILRNYFKMDLTMKSLQTSGLWHFAHKEMQNLGIDDFRSYLQTKNGEAMAKRYGFSSKLYVQVILDKYKGFI